MASRLRASLRGYATKGSSGLGLQPAPSWSSNPSFPGGKSSNPFIAMGQKARYKPKSKPRPTAPATAPAAAPSPPASTPPPGPTSMPWDTNYESRVSGVNRDRDLTLSGLTAEELNVKQQYGFDDPSNPFNKLKMMERAFQQSRSGTTNSMASSGQFYSGAHQRAQDELAFDESQSRDSLRRGYDQILADIQARRVQAQNAADDAIGEANYDRLLAALENRPEGEPPQTKQSVFDAAMKAWGAPGAKPSEFDGKQTKAEKKKADKKNKKKGKG